MIFKEQKTSLTRGPGLSKLNSRLDGLRTNTSEDAIDQDAFAVTGKEGSLERR